MIRKVSLEMDLFDARRSIDLELLLPGWPPIVMWWYEDDPAEYWEVVAATMVDGKLHRSIHQNTVVSRQGEDILLITMAGEVHIPGTLGIDVREDVKEIAAMLRFEQPDRDELAACVAEHRRFVRAASTGGGRAPRHLTLTRRRLRAHRKALIYDLKRAGSRNASDVVDVLERDARRARKLARDDASRLVDHALRGRIHATGRQRHLAEMLVELVELELRLKGR